MTVESGSLSLHTRREGEILDITDKIQAFIGDGKVKNGVVFLFVPGSTAALTTIEFEPGLTVDLPNALERIARKLVHTSMRNSGMTETVTLMLEPL